jgi:hypothetical protein
MEDLVSPSPGESREEAYKRWAAERAEESERRRQAGKIAIWLERSPDDAETFTKDHQAELREVLDPILRDKELEIEAPALAVDSVDVVGGYTGELIIAVASIPAIAQVLVAWVQRKPGRTVRVEFHPSGKVKTVEAKTEEQVLSIVNALDQEARARASKAKKK